MSTTISYKGNTIATLSNETKTLTTAGTWVEEDISITDASGTAAISVVDTTDSHGGTVRTITALNISDTTAVASDVAQGKYFYTAQGVKTEGTASGGSGNVEIEIISENLHDSSEDVANTYINGSAESSYNNWTSTGYIPVKSDTYYCVKNTPGNKYNAFYKSDKTSAKASVIVPDSSVADNYVLIKTTSNTAYIRMSGASSGVANYEIYEVNIVSATAHTIYFEFSDSTNTSITAYYDNTFISDAITATTPTTYNNKTVTLAELDGIAWYNPANIPLNTELIDFTKCVSDTAIDDNGETYTEEWYYTSDYTPILTNMTFSYKTGRWIHFALYDKNKNIISVFDGQKVGTVDQNNSNVINGTLSGSQLPVNVAYIRLSGSGNNNSYMSLIRTA